MYRPRERWRPFVLFLGLFLGLLATASTGVPAAPAGASQESSLQQLLRRLREAREQQLAPVRGQVERLVEQLEGADANQREAAGPALRRQLVKLGAQSAPLLVPWIEPDALPDGAGPAGARGPRGPRGPEGGAEFRAREVALALRALPTPATTDDLLRVARGGSPEGRINAVVALAGSPEQARVRPVLREIYAEETGELRRRALETLASFPGSADLFVLALDDDELVEVALSALAAARDSEALVHVIGILESERASRHLTAILDYLRAVPDALDDAALEALAKALLGTALGSEAKVDVLDTLSRLDIDLDGSIKKELEPLTRSSSNQVSESALILLAGQRDSKSRRRLLEPYDEAVSRSKNRPKVYSRRADIYYRIGDLRAAIKDFKRALELGKGKGVDEEPYLGLARCYALQGKFREAAEYLDRAPISVATLHELAADPDFAEMVADKRGRESFHLPEDDEEKKGGS